MASTFLLHEATTHEVIYQAVMRTSLRDPIATNPVSIVVPDRHAAIKLKGLIGATSVTKLGNIESPKPRPLTPAERKRRLKVTKQIQALFAAKREQNMLIDINCTLIAAKPHPLSNSSTCIVTFHQSKYAKREDEFIVVSCSIQEFIAEFRLYAKTLITKKEQVFFNPAHYDPTIDPSQGYRTQANFHSASMLVLDFDKGSLSPDRFVEIFWTKAGRAGKRSFIICNTFSRSPEEPNRFRVILFFKTPARSLGAYQAVFDSVIARIVEEGYPIEEMGIDLSCRSGVQSFYIPCTNRAYPDHAFFEQYGTQTRDIARYGTDPSSYEKTVPVHPTLERMRQSSIAADVPSTLTPELSEMQAELRAMPRGQNDGFFTFGWKTAVHFKGDESKITEALLEAAGSDRSLQSKIKSVLTSLKNYGLM